MKNKKVVIISIIIVVCIIIAFCVLGYFAKNKISKNRISENKENIENTTDNILSQYNEIFINDISDEGNSIINSLENAIDNSMDNEIENTSVDNTQQDSQSTTPIAKNTSNDNSNISNNIEISNPTTQNQSNTNTSSITKPTYQKLSYGESENGRDLTYYSIAPANYTSTILLNFAIHGYEDAYARDAKLLVDRRSRSSAHSIGQRPIRSVPGERAASSGTELFGGLGISPNKRFCGAKRQSVYHSALLASFVCPCDLCK